MNVLHTIAGSHKKVKLSCREPQQPACSEKTAANYYAASAWPYVSSEKCSRHKQDELHSEVNLVVLSSLALLSDQHKVNDNKSKTHTGCKFSRLTFLFRTVVELPWQQVDVLQLQKLH